ncbi:MAG: hypothetical protein JSS82_07805 [Bacteroidetes bacterium]|nr:hypothetical protein [Bacteroidota bacterium]
MTEEKSSDTEKLPGISLCNRSNSTHTSITQVDVNWEKNFVCVSDKDSHIVKSVLGKHKIDVQYDPVEKVIVTEEGVIFRPRLSKDAIGDLVTLIAYKDDENELQDLLISENLEEPKKIHKAVKLGIVKIIIQKTAWRCFLKILKTFCVCNKNNCKLLCTKFRVKIVRKLGYVIFECVKRRDYESVYRLANIIHISLWDFSPSKAAAILTECDSSEFLRTFIPQLQSVQNLFFFGTGSGAAPLDLIENLQEKYIEDALYTFGIPLGERISLKGVKKPGYVSSLTEQKRRVVLLSYFDYDVMRSDLELFQDVFGSYTTILDFFIVFINHHADKVISNELTAVAYVEKLRESANHINGGRIMTTTHNLERYIRRHVDAQFALRTFVTCFLWYMLHNGTTRSLFFVHKMGLMPLYVQVNAIDQFPFLTYHNKKCRVHEAFNSGSAIGTTAWTRYSYTIFYSWILCRQPFCASHTPNEKLEPHSIDVQKSFEETNAVRSMNVAEYKSWKDFLSSKYFGTPQFLTPLWLSEPDVLFDSAHYPSSDQVDTLRMLCSGLKPSSAAYCLPSELQMYLFTSLWIEFLASCSCCGFNRPGVYLQ